MTSSQINKDKQSVSEMFNRISYKYDFLNHFLSFRRDIAWRKKLVKLLNEEQPKQILDIATGTGDLAIAALGTNPQKVTGIDIAKDMLEIAIKKSKETGKQENMEFMVADALNLPFEDNTFDAATVAFGVRNFENLETGLKEVKRVLKKGSKFYILEFSKPQSIVMRGLYKVYSRVYIPVVGRIFSKDFSAYKYLPDTIATFPSGKEFGEVVKECGYKLNKIEPLTFGIATIYIGEK
jgi:demethylmenaquinone methyltransferase/2-methoxy-6-polyprenyl-1,4-benzoquinol methylase